MFGVWTEEACDAFLADLQIIAPGNLMTAEQGMSDQAVQSAIIAFLKMQ